ncbi:hypothetical protein [Streptomyces sp. NPDC006691]|uniref:hypothetical protein n=1 Tax=Streptomyces sp. NPDC006691 TaxID=3364757 RepID=UPI0036B17041
MGSRAHGRTAACESGRWSPIWQHPLPTKASSTARSSGIPLSQALRVSYRLTESGAALGPALTELAALGPALTELAQWAEKYLLKGKGGC